MLLYFPIPMGRVQRGASRPTGPSLGDGAPARRTDDDRGRTAESRRGTVRRSAMAVSSSRRRCSSAPYGSLTQEQARSALVLAVGAKVLERTPDSHFGAVAPAGPRRFCGEARTLLWCASPTTSLGTGLRAALDTTPSGLAE